MMIHFRKSGHPPFGGTSAFFRGALKSQGRGRKSVHCNAGPATASFYFASLSPSISSVSTEQSRTGVKNLLRRLQISLPLVPGIWLLKWKKDSESKVAHTDVSILTKSLLINVPVQGHTVQQNRKPSGVIRVSNASEDVGCIRKVSRRQYSVTIHDI